MSKKLSYIILIAFVLGILGGFLFPSVFTTIAFLGTIYINLMKLIVVPILFFGIVSALINSNFSSKMTVGTILLFIGMFITSFLITFALVEIGQPGVGFQIPDVVWNNDIVNLSIKDFFVSIIPSNIISAAANNQILPVVLFAFVFGLALRKINVPTFNNWFYEMNEVFNKILSWIMWLTPIGVFALIGETAALYGKTLITQTLLYIGMAWLGCLLVTILVMILPVWIICKISPWQYLKRVSKIWAMTLSTCSSAATLPETIRVCNEEFNIPKDVTSIVVPLGCTIHMCGGAVSFALLALFTAQMCNIPVTGTMFIMMLLAALFINMGAPGIPGGGIVLGATYLNLLGLPLIFMGVYAGIYRLLDMAYTTMNVTGDITANCIIKESLK